MTEDTTTTPTGTLVFADQVEAGQTVAPFTMHGGDAERFPMLVLQKRTSGALTWLLGDRGGLPTAAQVGATRPMLILATP